MTDIKIVTQEDKYLIVDAFGRTHFACYSEEDAIRIAEQLCYEEGHTLVELPPEDTRTGAHLF